MTCKSFVSREFFWNLTSRSRSIFVSLFILDLDVKAFSFHFSFLKWVNQIFISLLELPISTLAGHCFLVFNVLQNSKPEAEPIALIRLKIVMFSNFFNFHFLHRGLCQSIICHRFSIPGKFNVEAKLCSVAEHNIWVLQTLGAVHDLVIIALHLHSHLCNFATMPQALYFECTCTCNTVSTGRIMAMFVKLFWGNFMIGPRLTASLASYTPL